MCLSCPQALRDTPLARYSLFVLKLPLNTDQLTNSSPYRWWVCCSGSISWRTDRRNIRRSRVSPRATWTSHRPAPCCSSYRWNTRGAKVCSCTLFHLYWSPDAQICINNGLRRRGMA